MKSVRLIFASVFLRRSRATVWMSLFASAALPLGAIAADEAPESSSDESEKKPKVEVVQPDNFVLNLIMIQDGDTEVDVKVAEAGKNFNLYMSDPDVTLTASFKFVDEASSQLLIEYMFNYNQPKKPTTKSSSAGGESNEVTPTEKEEKNPTISLSGSVKVNPNRPIVFFANQRTELSMTLLQTGDFVGTSGDKGKPGVVNKAIPRANAKPARVRRVPIPPIPPKPPARRVVLPPNR